MGDRADLYVALSASAIMLARGNPPKLQFSGMLKVRAALPTDTPAASKIVVETLRSYGIEPDVKGLDRDLVTVGQPKTPSTIELVAELDGQIVGVAVFEVKSAQKGFLCGLYVDASFRGRGIGKNLLSEIISKARKNGLEVVELQTRAIFREAVALYEKTGWTRGPDTGYSSGPERSYFLTLT